MKDGFDGLLAHIAHWLIWLRSADDLEMRDTLDGNVDCLVLGTDIGTFAVCISLVADGNELPTMAAPPADLVPLAGHLEPAIGPIRVRVLRDEGLECVWALFLDEDVIAGVRLEGMTV